jgi:hypothetical protein
MGLGVGGTHDVGGGGAVVRAVRRRARLAVGVGRPRRLPLVDHQVDGHLALQAADVAVAEVVAQLVYLRKNIPLYSFITNWNYVPIVSSGIEPLRQYIHTTHVLFLKGY